jgi:hypothetical protein
MKLQQLLATTNTITHNMHSTTQHHLDSIVPLEAAAVAATELEGAATEA